MFMDDSGIDSGDKLESLLIGELGSFAEGHHAKDTMPPTAGKDNLDSDAESDIYSKLHDFDVVFEDPHDKLQDPARAAAAEAAAPVPDGAYFPAGRHEHAPGRKVLTSDNSTDSFASSTVTSNGGGGVPTVPSGASSIDEGTHSRDHSLTAKLNTCKILQRKLELKVERAKRNYKQMYQDSQESVEREPKISSLIPISRLPIPACRDSHQLVDVNTGFNSDDDLENVSFFPRATRKSSGSLGRQELSDTFSIQEMTIESDNDDLDFEQCRKLSDSKGYRKILNRSSGGAAGVGRDDYLDNDTLDEDDDSQNLELLPPKGGYALKEHLRRAFCCCRKDDFL